MSYYIVYEASYTSRPVGGGPGSSSLPVKYNTIIDEHPFSFMNRFNRVNKDLITRAGFIGTAVCTLLWWKEISEEEVGLFYDKNPL